MRTAVIRAYGGQSPSCACCGEVRTPGEVNPRSNAAQMTKIAKIGSRLCTRCKQLLAESEFYPDKIGPGGLQSRCRSCTREASRSRLRALRCAALVHYSSGDVHCQCCGERDEKFLALDHGLKGVISSTLILGTPGIQRVIAQRSSVTGPGSPPDLPWCGPCPRRRQHHSSPAGCRVIRPPSG